MYKDLVQIQKYSTFEKIAVDLETTGLSWRKDKILGVSIAFDKYASYWPWDLWGPQDKAVLAQMLANPNQLKIFHNAKFDMHFLMSAGMPTVNAHDTMTMSILSNENGTHKLKDLAVRHIDPNAKESKEAMMQYMTDHGQDPAAFDLSKVPEKIVAEYARMDAYYTYHLHDYYIDEMKTKFKKVFENETELLPVIIKMEREGVPIDKDYLQTQGAIMEEEAKKLEVEIRAELSTKWGEDPIAVDTKTPFVPKDMNLDSNDQLAKMVTEVYGVTLPKTRTGRLKTDKYTLDALEIPICTKIRDFRQINHLIATYCTGLSERYDKGKLYCQFRQNGAVTGRFSSADPNLQNIPRDLYGIRKAFICPKGFTLFSFDYDQMEMRLFAHYANEMQMKDAFEKGMDIYEFVARKLFNIPDDLEVAKEKRRESKTICLALIYGMGIAKMATKLGVDYNTAQELKAWFFRLFPKVKEFMDAVMLRIRERGFVFNSFGRYRRHHVDEAYKAVNSLIQGCAADIIKIAMVRIDKLLENRKSKMLIQVHDELILKIHDSEIKTLVPKIKEVMADFPEFRVPLGVTIASSKISWQDKEEWK